MQTTQERSEFVTVHVACEMCPSSDGMCIREDGSKYCFACLGNKFADSSDKEQAVAKSATVQSVLISGTYPEVLKNRGITKDILEFFNYQIGTYQGNPVHIANVHNAQGKLVAQQLRTANKDFIFLGQASNLGLVGTHLWEPKDTVHITIVEGYIDQLSVAQAQSTRWPVLTVPAGVGSAYKAIQRDLEYLNKWKYVVLAFDNDEAGKAAMEKCSELFEPGKVRIATWPRKDANDSIVLGQYDEVRETLWNAKTVKPDSVVKPSDLLEEILRKPVIGTPWLFPQLTDMTFGIHPEQLIVLGSGPGIGKSHFIDNIVADLIYTKDIPVGIFSFEHGAAEFCRKMAGLRMGKALHLPGALTYTDSEVAAITEAVKEADKNLSVYKAVGSVKSTELVNKIRYMVKGEGAKVVIIDNLTNISSDTKYKEATKEDEILDSLQSLTRELKCTIILVCHFAKDKKTITIKSKEGSHQEDDSWGKGRRAVLESFKGSQVIGSAADVVLALARNAESEDREVRDILHVGCLKSKANGQSRGTWFSLRYNPITAKLEEIKGDFE